MLTTSHAGTRLESVTTTAPVDPFTFGIFVGQCVQMLFVCQAVQVASAMLSEQPYVASPESGSRTRQSLGAMGLTQIPGPRKVRLSAAERAQQKAIADARKAGFEGGRFTGCR